MNFAGLLFLLITHFLSGRGILRLFKLQLDPIPAVCLSFILGVPAVSFVPCILQLMKIPLAANSVYIGISVFTAVCCIPLLVSFTKPRLPKFIMPKLYEWPALLVLLFFVVVSVWRCYYMPPYSRDMLSGPELIAEYAVREKTMINSVFNIDLHTSNNYFKSPYVTTLQIIYKLLVFPFGQLWLSVMFVSFTTFIYSLLMDRVHPLIAGFLMLIFFAVPELFAYTFVILYDYSNMVLFFTGFYFLTRYMQNEKFNDFIFSSLLFGLATYIRTESLILIAFMSPLFLVHRYRQKMPLAKIALRLAIFMGVSIVFYVICIKIFVHNFVPLPLDVSHEINKHITDFSPLFKRLSDIVTVLIFSDTGPIFYGCFIIFFVYLAIADLVWPRKYNKEALYALYGVAVIYFGFGFIGYLLPLADLQNTTKRGFFKIIPIMLLYMANSGLIQRLSNAIKWWEDPESAPKKKVVAAPTPKRKLAPAPPPQVANRPKKR